jgi:hypothetical protein
MRNIAPRPGRMDLLCGFLTGALLHCMAGFHLLSTLLAIRTLSHLLNMLSNISAKSAREWT